MKKTNNNFGSIKMLHYKSKTEKFWNARVKVLQQREYFNKTNFLIFLFVA
jgi:hypothetical protein